MVRLAMIADVHAHKGGAALLEPVFAGIETQADALVIAGDLTTLGLVEDAEALAEVVEPIPIPKVGILGNHDYHSRQERRICETIVAAGVTMLDGTSTVLHFAPIPETVHGEPPELYPMLGSSLLWRPIVQKRVDLVIHGHAHYGTPFFQPEEGPPVYNVARPLNHNRCVIHTFS